MSIRKGNKIIAGFGSGGDGDSIKNQNPVSPIEKVYDWVGTLEEYEEQDIDNTHPEWVCFVTDDIEGGDSVYTKEETNTLLSDKLSYDRITNCITYIPQDIKLELNDGVLTLKAGSKVYYPNGFEEDGTTRKFGYYIVSEDREVHFPTTGVIAGKGWIVGLYDEAGTSAFWGGPGITISSDTEPTVTYDNLTWYDTANNIIKVWQDTEQSWTTELHGYKYILPPCLFTISSEGKVTINQVFNGFGYIGNITFILPGVTAAFADGFNEDGTYKNIIVKNQKVNIKDLSLEYSFYATLYIKDNNNLSVGGWGEANYYEGDEYPSSMMIQGRQEWWYNTLQNKVYMTSVETPDVWKQRYVINIGTLTKVANENITEFKINKTLKILDYNNTEYISHQAMPSNKYIDLTLGASGALYTTPTDGYVLIRTVANNGACSITIHQTSNPTFGNSTYIQSGDDGRLFVQFGKGTRFRVWYSNIGTGTGTDATLFKFVYTNGSK